MLGKITPFLKEKFRCPKIYFGKNIRNIPTGAFIFFPVQESQLNCGLTGIVTFKKNQSEKRKIPLDKIEAMVYDIRKYTYKKIQKEKGDFAENYLGGDIFLNELKDHVENLKLTPSLYTLFIEVSARKKLEKISLALEKILNSEENENRQRVNFPSFKEKEIIIERISLLKDLQWSLKKETLNNLEKIALLCSSKDKHMPLLVFQQLRNINSLFNNLDRLEVRGRDSAGISVISIVNDRNYQLFEKELESKSLSHEFLNRQREKILLNKSITINRYQNKASVVFTYKIAAQIGHLGDNVKFLRKQIQDDSIFQSFIAFPTIHQTTISHTRWASVGDISEQNCHPLDNNAIGKEQDTEFNNGDGIIHVCLNGDIDNYLLLKEEYEKETRKSIPNQINTDTKIIPLQIQKYYDRGHPIEESFRMAVNDFTGSHAIAMHTDLAPGKLFLSQRGSGQTLFIGLGKEQYIASSEIYGLVEDISRYIKMEGENKGQIFILDQDSHGGLKGIKAIYYNGDPVQLSENIIKQTGITGRDIDRQDFPHYFLKEIFESPGSVEKTVRNRWRMLQKNENEHSLTILDDMTIPPALAKAFRQNEIREILFIGQGTAGVAGYGCAELLRHYLADSVIHIASLKASEFSGSTLKANLKNSLIIAITQSGTTTDTNRAIVMAREREAYTLAIVNRRDSDITFKVDGVLYTSTGRDIEMSVASTKAYYSQIAAGCMLGLKITQLIKNRDDAFLHGEIERLMLIPSLMQKVLASKNEIKESAYTFAPAKKYWAVVGSGYNKIAADEIRIKLSELSYKTISSDVVEDKKHIDLSSEPLIVICAAGSRGNVISDIIKDTAIFKAHNATTIVIASEGEEGFRPYADSLIFVPEIDERFSPILTTLAGHLWGYYAAQAINEESLFLSNFRLDISSYIAKNLKKGLDIYQTILEKPFQENTAKFFSSFKERLGKGRYTTALESDVASDLTLLLKYLSGRLPTSDFELDFGISGTAPNIYQSFLEGIGKAINDMARPIDAIKHQAKTVTVGTSRIWEPIEGLLFESLKENGFDEGTITNKNLIVLRNLQTIIEQIKGETLYQISDLTYAGEPVEESKITVIRKKGSSEGLKSRVKNDSKLKGTKKIIVKAGNVFIGKGKIDSRSILVIPVMKHGPTIDHLLLLDISFKEKIKLRDKIKALGEKYDHIKNIVEETGISWEDNYLDLIDVEILFGSSAEKISEILISSILH